ncbi:hypothetical protein [Clostridium butyricum]|uniref:hypothetical protein n=1 Tax=Clostridium butyricum TaxID=1492 RepID=UPI0012B6CFD7|nr:hypothetical protein [Clostridium butyricum]
MNKKKVYIIEYDDNGNEIDRNLLTDNESLRNLLLLNQYAVNGRFLLDLNYRSLFSSEQWDFIENFSDIIKVYIKKDDDFDFYPKFAYANINDEDVALLKELFNGPRERLELIKNLRYSSYYNKPSFWILSPDGHTSITYDKNSLKSIYNWINSRDGIYYSINNNNSKTWDFVDRPSKKQAIYQRRKGRRIVFLSFRDFKEYIINEYELL